MRIRDMIPATQHRVEQSTSHVARERIRSRIEKNVAAYAGAPPEVIERRIDELDKEWDIERALESNAAGVILSGLVLGTFVHRRWLALSGVAAAFLLQHALQGWCPPLPIFRRLGVRTASEIDEEREALRILRGDYQRTGSPCEALAQVRTEKRL